MCRMCPYTFRTCLSNCAQRVGNVKRVHPRSAHLPTAEYGMRCKNIIDVTKWASVYSASLIDPNCINSKCFTCQHFLILTILLLLRTLAKSYLIPSIRNFFFKFSHYLNTCSRRAMKRYLIYSAILSGFTLNCCGTDVEKTKPSKFSSTLMIDKIPTRNYVTLLMYSHSAIRRQRSIVETVPPSFEPFIQSRRDITRNSRSALRVAWNKVICRRTSPRRISTSAAPYTRQIHPQYNNSER